MAVKRAASALSVEEEEEHIEEEEEHIEEAGSEGRREGGWREQHIKHTIN